MHDKNIQVQCPNCGNFFDAQFNYCPYCGQENKPIDLKFSSIIKEFLSANFNIEAPIFATLKLLGTKPAKLTKEFLAGKRQKYISPVRLYLIVSFFYFLILSITPNQINININVNANSKQVITQQQTSNLATIFEDKINTLENQKGRQTFWHKMQNNFSLAMFLLIPITALVLLIFFPGKIYVAHLVFTLHLQSIIFLLLGFLNIFSFFINSDWLLFIKFIVITSVSFLWIKKFYNLNIFSTIWRMVLSGTFIATIYLFATIIITLISLLMI